MGKSKSYTKSHSGAGGGSAAYGSNKSRSDARPEFAKSGTASAQTRPAGSAPPAASVGSAPGGSAGGMKKRDC